MVIHKDFICQKQLINWICNKKGMELCGLQHWQKQNSVEN